jgi:nucleoside-diphosphate-sugar epimerase
MRVLITGASGFLGQGLVVPFEERGDTLRLLDVAPMETPHEQVAGDVTDLEFAINAVDGVDAIVIAHMARNSDGAYDVPTKPFDVNVKGTANLFHAAIQHGVKAVVLISSTGVLEAYSEQAVIHHDLPPRAGGKGYYTLSKICQEAIAESFSSVYGIRVACLRIGYVLDGETNRDKYGRLVQERAAPDTDRRDVGEVARRFIERDDLNFERFTVMSTAESMQRWDVAYTCERLQWKPRYDFSWLPAASS